MCIVCGQGGGEQGLVSGLSSVILGQEQAQRLCFSSLDGVDQLVRGLKVFL